MTLDNREYLKQKDQCLVHKIFSDAHRPLAVFETLPVASDKGEIDHLQLNHFFGQTFEIPPKFLFTEQINFCEVMMKIALLTTGGTIAMAREKGKELSSLSLDPNYFAKNLPLNDKDEIMLIDYSKMPSFNFDSQYAQGLANKIEEMQRDIGGLIVLHGTDTMEETAFYLELVLNNKMPIVLTGAMLTATQHGYDGIGNLISSVKTLKNPPASTNNILIVFNKDIISAVHGAKIESERPNAFGSLQTGKIGSIIGNKVIYYYNPVKHVKLCNIPRGRITILKLHYDIEPTIFKACVDKADIIIIETFGSGRVPYKLLAIIDDAICKNKIFILTTRAFSGHLYDEYDYNGSFQYFVKRNVIISPLNSLKSALLAKLCFGNDKQFDEMKRIFEDFFS